MKKSRLLVAVCACIFTFTLSTSASAAILYSNGFETDIAGWDAFGGTYNPTRVASGTNGITSASGDFHAESSASGSAGNMGGYNYGAGGGVATVFQEYTTSVDIYLDVAGGWANDTRFDLDSAINDNSGNFLRDFIFNAGFYNDNDGSPGSGTDRFIISASNNSSPNDAYPKNPGRNPISIDTSGWYTFEHHFYDNGGTLNVDLSILTSGGSLVNTWTLGTDAITGVGGNRYTWFAYQDFSVLAFDNTSLETAAVPVPAAVWLFGSGLLGLVGISRRKKAA